MIKSKELKTNISLTHSLILSLLLSHTLLITCTCCYDQIKGTQDRDFSYSFCDSLSPSLRIASPGAVSKGNIPVSGSWRLWDSVSRLLLPIETLPEVSCRLVQHKEIQQQILLNGSAVAQSLLLGCGLTVSSDAELQLVLTRVVDDLISAPPNAPSWEASKKRDAQGAVEVLLEGVHWEQMVSWLLRKGASLYAGLRATNSQNWQQLRKLEVRRLAVSQSVSQSSRLCVLYGYCVVCHII